MTRRTLFGWDVKQKMIAINCIANQGAVYSRPGSLPAFALLSLKTPLAAWKVGGQRKYRVSCIFFENQKDNRTTCILDQVKTAEKFSGFYLILGRAIFHKIALPSLFLYAFLPQRLGRKAAQPVLLSTRAKWQ